MVGKKTNDISDWGRDDDSALFGADGQSPLGEEAPEDASHSASDDDEREEVLLHYPQPTALSIVVQAVAKWSELNFVMDPALNRSLQIFAPRKMAKPEALQIFVASLETIGLRAVQMQGKVVKIVPMSNGRISA